jgi:hypothetical protein
MPKPRIVIDPLPRTIEMIFDPGTWQRLEALGDLVVFDPNPPAEAGLDRALADGEILIGPTALSRSSDLELCYAACHRSVVVRRNPRQWVGCAVCR